MFSLKDFLNYMAVQKAFAEMRKETDELYSNKPRVPYLGSLKQSRPEPVNILPPVNDLSQPRRILTPPPTVKYIEPVQNTKDSIYVNRVGCIKKLKLK